MLLEDIGHCPQLDVPVEAAQLILGFTFGAVIKAARASFGEADALRRSDRRRLE